MSTMNPEGLDGGPIPDWEGPDDRAAFQEAVLADIYAARRAAEAATPIVVEWPSSYHQMASGTRAERLRDAALTAGRWLLGYLGYHG